MDIKDRFNQAVNNSKELTRRPDNEVLLKLYALFKQATEGNVSGERPGGFDFKGAAKYDAWVKEKDKTKEEVMQEYIQTVKNLMDLESSQ